MELAKPTIRAAVAPLRRNGAFAVTLRTNRPALWTWLELKSTDARLSDNFVHLRPGAPVTIEVEPASPLPLGEFKKQLRVRCLQDTY